MNLHFKYEHTPELSYDFANHYWKSKRLLKIVFGGIVLVLVFQLISTATKEDVTLESIATVLLPIGMILVIWLWLIPASLKKQIQRADRQSNLGKEREMIFRDEDILIKTAQSESSFPYEGLLQYATSEHSYFLYIGSSQAMIIPKSSMAEGEGDELEALLQEKQVPYLGR
jgi:hypothetical protein